MPPRGETGPRHLIDIAERPKALTGFGIDGAATGHWHRGREVLRVKSAQSFDGRAVSVSDVGGLTWIICQVEQLLRSRVNASDPIWSLACSNPDFLSVRSGEDQLPGALSNHSCEQLRMLGKNGPGRQDSAGRECWPQRHTRERPRQWKGGVLKHRRRDIDLMHRGLQP